ncbi:Protein of unknown function (DUF3037) [Chitinophaga skermanii]|uniref:DUF3037 family protein n=1 Tax=Chitinophaga skermanii TaxID=331697 RepID=A0A327R411_9BACT|nr:DUF3037 domain-containing protein [Chitinophaga skermanii]RAJ08617.1 Protein of unknown function (DUF3037) [Chitinophaga skermanii]
MQDNHLFEYAVIRVVPRVEREEFLNVGVIVYCKSKRYLGVKITLNEQRLQAFCPVADVEEVKTYLHAIETITAGNKGSGPIGQLDQASRFRWLTATRSTIIQSSKTHTGLAKDPAAILERLHEQLVL